MLRVSTRGRYQLGCLGCSAHSGESPRCLRRLHSTVGENDPNPHTVRVPKFATEITRVHYVVNIVRYGQLVYKPGLSLSLYACPFMSPLSLAKFVVPTGTRAIVNSASAGKALPFSLHGLRAGVDECNNGQTLRMLMFGKPGAGKGTLSSRLVKKYDILAISTGDLLRQHIAEGSVHCFIASGAPLTYFQDTSWAPSRRDSSTRRTCP